jgi:hypothetical protein
MNDNEKTESSNSIGVPCERHFTVSEIAKQLHLSDSKVREIFRVEPGVIPVGEPSRLIGGRVYKRRYQTLRIPESALRRVLDRLMNKRPAGRSDRPLLDGKGKRNAG